MLSNTTKDTFWFESILCLICLYFEYQLSIMIMYLNKLASFSKFPLSYYQFSTNYQRLCRSSTRFGESIRSNGYLFSVNNLNSFNQSSNSIYLALKLRYNSSLSSIAYIFPYSTISFNSWQKYFSFLFNCSASLDQIHFPSFAKSF